MTHKMFNSIKYLSHDSLVEFNNRSNVKYIVHVKMATFIMSHPATLC